MYWKSIVCAGLLCVLAVPAYGLDLVVTSSYNQGLGVIEWEISVDNDTGTSALAVEIPLELTEIFDATDTANNALYDPFLNANSSTSETTNSSGDNNGAADETWYYNETSLGSTSLLWNTQEDETMLLQNLGANPYDGGDTEGLWLETAMNRLFAALGSDVNLGDPVPTLHIASSDGELSWTDAILAEDGSQGAGGGSATVSGSASSVILADMNGDGNINSLDVNPFVRVVTGSHASYAASFPGLDGQARADINQDGAVNSLDVSPFVVCVTSGCAGSGGGGVAGGGSSAVPEPATALLMVLGSVALAMFRRRR